MGAFRAAFSKVGGSLKANKGLCVLPQMKALRRHCCSSIIQEAFGGQRLLMEKSRQREPLAVAQAASNQGSGGAVPGSAWLRSKRGHLPSREGWPVGSLFGCRAFNLFGPVGAGPSPRAPNREPLVHSAGWHGWPGEPRRSCRHRYRVERVSMAHGCWTGALLP